MVQSRAFTSPASAPVPVFVTNGTVAVQAGTVEVSNVTGGTLGRVNDVAGTVEISNLTGAYLGGLGTVNNLPYVGALGTVNNLPGVQGSVLVTNIGAVAGTVEVSAITGALPSGNNTIGDVTVSQPADNGRLIVVVAANNAGAPVLLPVYNATQSFLPVGIGAWPAGLSALEVMDGKHSTANLISGTATNVKASAGVLHGVTITTGWTGPCAIYNHASTNTNLVCTINNPSTGQYFPIRKNMTTGIRVLPGTTSAGTVDALVIYD